MPDQQQIFILELSFPRQKMHSAHGLLPVFWSAWYEYPCKPGLGNLKSERCSLVRVA